MYIYMYKTMTQADALLRVKGFLYESHETIFAINILWPVKSDVPNAAIVMLG